MELTPERWRQVASIYELAVEQEAASRPAFLAEACAGDEVLRREVESLLSQDSAVVLLDRSVWATAAPLLREGVDLPPGTALGPYRIDSPLGAGGMGEVFRGTDLRLNRAVAIKVLAPGAPLDENVRARFAREARAVAALTHPHICTLYDVGRHEQIDFLVMECLEGETLAARLEKEPLPLAEALTHAIEVAGALEHAHTHGIIHRDLKPANIMLTAGGAKLLDFGLAKFRAAALGPDTHEADGTHPVAPTGTRSRPLDGDDPVNSDGAVLGTLRYMAPEQIAGAEVDARCDLFSFGAVLFEMLTGRRAFDGDSAASVRAAIFEHDPPAVSSLQPLVPPAIDEIVRRCLARNPADRWPSAHEVVRALKHASESMRAARDTSRPMLTRTRLAGAVAVALVALGVWLMADRFQRRGATPSGQIRSVAVLPLVNLSGDPEQEYFADGMTEQLIANLAKAGALRVIARTSVMHYKDARKPVPAIARELNVDAIIEGSVVRANDTVRITATLIRGSSSEIVWTQSFERSARDVLALQSEVARAIARKVDVTLTPQEQARLADAPPVDPEIHRQVLLGRHHTAKATEESLRKAVDYFNVAIEKDPGNASAYAGLAEAYTGLSGFYVHPQEVMPKARQAAETAIRLDDSLAYAHAALGFIRLVYEWDGPGAEQSLLRALELNPTLASARLSYAAYLTSQARHDDGVREIRRAVDLDPLSIRTNAFATLFLLFSRSYDEAIELARRGLEFEPNAAFTLAFQGIAFSEQGRFAEAVSNVERAAKLDNSPTILSLKAHVLAVVGRKEEARALLVQLEEMMKQRYFCPYEIGTVYVSLGDKDTAYKWFRKGTAERADCMAWLGVEPWLDPFRADPRYATLLRDIGLTPPVH